MKNKNSFLYSRKFINIIALSFIAALVFGSVLFDESNNFDFDPVMGTIFIGAFIIATAIYLKKQKTITIINIDNNGIKTPKINYSWKDFKKYHLLGEYQSERFGFTRYRDVINPYKHANTQIFKLKKKNNFFNSWLNFEVEADKVSDIKDILNNHNIPHI